MIISANHNSIEKELLPCQICQLFLQFLVVVVAFLAGLEGILDQFQFHQPLVACTLIGAATGNLTAGIMLGGSLQMIALAWANIGAAVAPDAALASVAAAIIWLKVVTSQLKVSVLRLQQLSQLAVAGLFLTMLVRTASVALVHAADKAAESGTSLVLNVHTTSPSFFKVCVSLCQLPFFLLSQHNLFNMPLD